MIMQMSNVLRHRHQPADMTCIATLTWLQQWLWLQRHVHQLLV